MRCGSNRLVFRAHCSSSGFNASKFASNLPRRSTDCAFCFFSLPSTSCSCREKSYFLGSMICYFFSTFFSKHRQSINYDHASFVYAYSIEFYSGLVTLVNVPGFRFMQRENVTLGRCQQKFLDFNVRSVRKQNVNMRYSDYQFL